jgi:hypothetical protein
LGPLEFPTTIASLWLDTSIQIMRAAGAFWSGSLGASETASHRRSSSTASPWWIAREPQSAIDPASAWAAAWFPASGMGFHRPAAANPWLAAWSPLFPAASTPAPLGSIEAWQRAWLQGLPHLVAAGAAFAGPSGAARAWSGWPGLPAAAAPVPDWHPIAAAYRTANGHAVAAVLRTMAAVVEPRPRAGDLSSFWLSPLATRH